MLGNLATVSLMHTKGFPYRYTSMGTQVLAPKKGIILSFTLTFAIIGLYFFLLNLSEVYVQVKKVFYQF